MKPAVFAAAVAIVFPYAALAADKDLHGTWKLMSLSRKSADGTVEEPRGKVPRGYLHLGPDGRMMSVIVNEKRPKPASVAKMTDQERVQLFNSMNAYAGTYKLAGNKITYTFDVVHNEVPERAAVRDFKIDGRRMTMVNEVAASTMDGTMAQTVTVWEKVVPPQ